MPGSPPQGAADDSPALQEARPGAPEPRPDLNWRHLDVMLSMERRAQTYRRLDLLDTMQPYKTVIDTFDWSRDTNRPFDSLRLAQIYELIYGEPYYSMAETDGVWEVAAPEGLNLALVSLLTGTDDDDWEIIIDQESLRVIYYMKFRIF